MTAVILVVDTEGEVAELFTQRFRRPTGSSFRDFAAAQVGATCIAYLSHLAAGTAAYRLSRSI